MRDRHVDAPAPYLGPPVRTATIGAASLQPYCARRFACNLSYGAFEEGYAEHEASPILSSAGAPGAFALDGVEERLVFGSQRLELADPNHGWKRVYDSNTSR